MEGESLCQNLEAKLSSSVIAHHLDQLASVFYAADEDFIDFQREDECEIVAMSSSHVPEPGDIVSESSLQTILMKPYFCSNEHHIFYEKFRRCLSHDEHKKLLGENPSLIGTQVQVPSDEQNNSNLILSSQQEKDKSSPRDMEVASFTSNSSCASSVLSLPSKKRIKWSQALHKKFVHCVNSLGGAEKATPKAILKMMESKGLTIFHVKSHLQKYRSEKYMSGCKQDKPLLQGKAESITSDISLLCMKNNMKIKEALKLQLDVEKHLRQQLEIQRQLQQQIEENARQLKMMMMQQQQKINKCNL